MGFILGGPGVGTGRSGQGDRFARSRLMLARKAGYLPQNYMLARQPGAVSAQWRSASKNLSADARRAGYANPLLWLRESARQGKLISPGSYTRPSDRANVNDPQASLAYANQRLNQLRAAAPQMGGAILDAMRSRPVLETSPQEQWRYLSAILAEQAKAAGYMDPRVFLNNALAQSRQARVR